jgi:pyruvyltransferase
LFSVGSVLHFARDGDTVWGAGVNGKVAAEEHAFRRLDVRAVRGPLTREFLLNRGVDVPEVYGDPALLLPLLMPELAQAAHTKRHKVTVVPNFNDRWVIRGRDVVDPCGPLGEVLTRIVQSELVVGSSLHALIVAEAFGIPARALVSRTETDFKYADHYAGTGRGSFHRAADVREAIGLGGEPPLVWRPDALLAAFPRDLWMR